MIKGKYLGKYYSHALKMSVELLFPGVLLEDSPQEVPSGKLAGVKGQSKHACFLSCREITSPFSSIPRELGDWHREA